MKKLAGKVAVITGGSQGIGRSVALKMAQEGAHVCVLARNLDPLAQVIQEIEVLGGKATAYAVDLQKHQELESIFQQIAQHFGQVDIFAHFVGGFKKFIPLEEITQNEWNEVLQLNLTTAFFATQKIVPMMSNPGRIVYMGSIAGLGPNPNAKSYLPYGVAKAGMITMVKYLAKEYGAQGITVNCVSPGTTATPRVIAIRGEQGIQDLANSNPLQHVLQPEDSAAAVMFLVSPEAAGITGINMNVNAGSVMN
jgi:3-oxoacyl-[acyl-carrier protein] reductase